MKKEHISDAIGNLSDGIITECDTLRRKSNNRAYVMRTVAAVASFAIIFMGAVVLMRQQNDPPIVGPNDTDVSDTEDTVDTTDTEPPDTEPTDTDTEPPVTDPPDTEPPITDPSLLPTLEISGENDGMGLGIEFYTENSVDEIDFGTPWQDEWAFESILVYDNPKEYFSFGMRKGEEADILYARLEKTASVFGFDLTDVNSVQIYDDTPTTAQLENLIMQCEGMGIPIPDGLDLPSYARASSVDWSIIAHSGGSMRVEFKKAFVLPEEYRFDYIDGTYEDAVKSAEYLVEQYKTLFGFDSNNITVEFAYNGFDVHYAGQNAIENEAYSYMNRVHFTFDDSGNLDSINYSGVTPRAMGEYPAISAEEAKSLLLEGKFLDNIGRSYVPNGITEEYIVGMSLVYRSWIGDRYILPYYKFIVYIPEHNLFIDENMYIAFFVPAIDQKYVEYPGKTSFN